MDVLKDCGMFEYRMYASSVMTQKEVEVSATALNMVDCKCESRATSEREKKKKYDSLRS